MGDRSRAGSRGKADGINKLNSPFIAENQHTMYSESEVAQLYLTLCNPVDCSPPGPSVHRILQARILEWVAVSPTLCIGRLKKKNREISTYLKIHVRKSKYRNRSGCHLGTEPGRRKEFKNKLAFQ